MSIFTLREFEQTGSRTSGELRVLGERQTRAGTAAEGKGWLSEMIAYGRLQGDRFYRFESIDCALEFRRDLLVNISFYLFGDGRLCPLRIWGQGERRAGNGGEPEWTADFEGIPGWSLIASMEPRWRCVRTVPAERWWMGRSKRDWQQRDCWVLASASSRIEAEAA